MVVSVGWWWLGGCVDGCVGRLVVVGWMFGWMCRWFGGCVDGFVGRWLVVEWICRRMCPWVGGVWVDLSVGGWWLGGCG